jgi:hypothetical protein
MLIRHGNCNHGFGVPFLSYVSFRRAVVSRNGDVGINYDPIFLDHGFGMETLQETTMTLAAPPPIGTNSSRHCQ